MKNKLIIILSVFLVFLILIIPSFSSVQIRTGENKIQNKFTAQEDILDFRELNEEIVLDNFIKHPILFF